MSAQARLLPDGVRLHLHHGPIDLIIKVDAPARAQAYGLAVDRFETVLEELVAELPSLRKIAERQPLAGRIARRMQAATLPLARQFITPMAAVAGAVADEICAAMQPAGPRKCYVNNGGDVAFSLAPGESMMAGAAWGRAELTHDTVWRGIASSGWRGRSHSLGIADTVSVIARTAAQADAAATMIANAVDLPGHPAVTRRAAQTLCSDSDLGQRLVTVDVGQLSDMQADTALSRGALYAQGLLDRGLIGGACLVLSGRSQTLGPALTLLETERLNA